MRWHESSLPRARRWGALGLRGATVWLTGLSGSGKTTVATQLARLLSVEGRLVVILDGDELREGLCEDLGPDAGLDEEVRRIGELARLFADAGAIAVAASTSPLRAQRRAVRSAHRAADLGFLEVWVDTPPAVCEQRDPHKRFTRAHAGELAGVAGVDLVYEAPLDPDLVLSPDDGPSVEQARAILDRLVHEHFVERQVLEPWENLERWLPAE